MSELEARDDALERRLRREGEVWRAERVACPHPDLLLGRSSDALDAGVRTRLAQQLTECPPCSRLIRDLDEDRGVVVIGRRVGGDTKPRVGRLGVSVASVASEPFDHRCGTFAPEHRPQKAGQGIQGIDGLEDGFTHLRLHARECIPQGARRVGDEPDR